MDSNTYAVCYAAGTGLANDTTWRDSYVRVKISKMESISAHSLTHKTNCQIARVGGTYESWDGNAYQTVQVADLELTYSGSLDNQKWVSLVNQALDESQPCDSGAVATGSAGTAYSGVLQPAGASSKMVSVDTLGMSTTLTFAVCYAETNGTAADNTWADSGIRLTVSKVTSVEYGEAHSSLPVRTWRSTNIMAATNRLPQVAGAQITYVGDLGNAEWLSIVDASQNSNNPCVAGASAAHAEGTGY